MEAQRRGIAARIGVVALNLLYPGPGLLRTQRLKLAVIFLVAPHALIGLLVVVFASAPVLNFTGWAIALAATLAGIALIYLGSLVLSWRTSRDAQSAGPWWSRWYGMTGLLVVSLVLGNLLGETARAHYRTFYLPSEAMSSTLLKNDRIVGRMRGPGELRRGDVILFDMGTAIYIKRVAALPGDRIALQDGVVILNGRPVPQRLLRSEEVSRTVHGTRARRLSEQFPGENSPHEIYDRGLSPGDDTAEHRVRPGHVFVLGDDRDGSADSRYSRAEFGVEQLAISDIRGHALFYLWGPSGRMGELISR